MRLEILSTEFGARAIVTETLEKTEKQGILPVVFDIDVVKTMVLYPRSRELWEIAEDLRRFKNSIFHGSLTASAKALFE